MFHPVSSLVSSVECVFTNTCTFSSVSWSQLSIEVSSNNRYAVSAVSRVLLDCSVPFFRCPEWGSIRSYTHQFDTLVVNHDRGSDGSFVDVFGVYDFCRHFLFSIIPTPCVLSYFPAPMNIEKKDTRRPPEREKDTRRPPEREKDTRRQAGE